MDIQNVLELVTYIVKNLVSETESIKIDYEKQDEKNTVIYVKLAESDMGKVIGKNGKTANAIRSIIKSITAAEKQNYHIKISKKEG